MLFENGFESNGTACWDTTVPGPPIGTCPPKPITGPTYSSDGVLHHVAKDDGTEQRVVVYLVGRPVAILSVDAVGTPTYTYLTTDHLGTPVLATDAAGVALWDGGFEPFGADYDGASGVGMFLRFPGQWVDEAWGIEETYNVYPWYRWYTATVGKYSRPDPYLRILMGRPYNYVRGNPLVNFDPLGLHPTHSNAPHGGPNHYMAPPEGDIECVAQIRDQVRRGADGRTRYQHCLGNCLIAMQCPGGKSTAVLASLFKEFSDLTRCMIQRKGGNCDSAFQDEDFDDNSLGRRCPQGVTCQEQCSRLLTADNPPPDPFGEFKPGTLQGGESSDDE